MSNEENVNFGSIRVTILMPTLNAARTIERALRSVRDQTTAQNRVEILVVDGGSTDRTREIAVRYGAIVLDNPLVVPENAKHIGLIRARGDYLVEMDADEYFVSPTQLDRRLAVFERYPDIKCILTDRLLTPENADVACAYLNIAGDPFSYFVYRPKGSVSRTFRKNRLNPVAEGIQIFHFSDGDILPIADGGASMVDMRYVRSVFGDRLDQISFASTVCGDVVARTLRFGCIKGDDIVHDSSAELYGYLKKLKFRVVNNVHDPARSGYSARSDSNKTLSRRKYLYPLYCLTLIGPLYDAIELSVSRRDASFLLHPLYVYFVMIQICMQYMRKLFHKGGTNASYGAGSAQRPEEGVRPKKA